MPTKPGPQNYIVYFDLDKSHLDQTAMATIDEAAQMALDQKASSVVIIGHTDRAASNAYNVGLSNRRATVVAGALEAKGVSRALMSLEWMGESTPAVATRDGVPNRHNRRTTIELGF